MDKRRLGRPVQPLAEARVMQVLQAAPDGIVVINREGCILFANQALGRMFLHDSTALVGRSIETLLPVHLRTIHEARRRAYLRTRRVCSMGPGRDLVGLRRDGTTVPIAVRLSPLNDRRDGLVIGVIREVSEPLSDREQLNAAVRQKESLLMEVHHPIKNNMQVAASLINLRKPQILDASARDIVDNILIVIQTIALLHDDLHRSHGDPSVDLGTYLGRVIQDLSELYRSAWSGVTFHRHVESVVVDADAAVDLGLVVCELVSNAMKHAFVERTSGDVLVALKRTGDGGFELVVADNGIGLKPESGRTEETSIGLRFVFNVVANIGATINVQRAPGATFTIRVRAPRQMDGSKT